MQSNTQIVDVVNQFTKEIEVMMLLILDLEGTQRGQKLKTTANKMDLPLKFFEKKTHWMNLAELYIGLLKVSIRSDMHKKAIVLLYFGITTRKEEH